jgi:hypothetical protein
MNALVNINSEFLAIGPALSQPIGSLGPPAPRWRRPCAPSFAGLETILTERD